VEQRRYQDKPWLREVWEAVGVVAGERYRAPVPERVLMREDATSRQYLWRGFEMRLYRDEVAGYYFNLRGDQPGVFVICRPVEGGAELTPCQVTVSYDYAAASMEVDDQVFRVPFAPELYLWVEGFVIEHYRPERKRKRERQPWARDAWAPEARVMPPRADDD
jgi:hypothetical protein